MTILFTRKAALAAWFVLVMLGLRPAAWAQARTATYAWAARAASTSNARANSYTDQVQIDTAGNTYVAGNFSYDLTLGSITLTAQDTADAYVAKFTSTGSVAWVVAFSGPGRQQGIRNLRLDAAGNVYVAGEFQQALTVGTTTLTDGGSLPPTNQYYNGFVVKLSPQGGVLWSTRLGRDANFPTTTVNCSGLAVDAAGNVAVSGYFVGTFAVAGQALTSLPSTAPSYFVALLDPTSSGGSTGQWARVIDAQHSVSNTFVSFDAAGGLYFCTALFGNIQFDTILLPSPAGTGETALAYYNVAGTVQWAVLVPSALPAVSGTVSAVQNIVPAAGGGLYLLSLTVDYTGSNAFVHQVARYTAAGTPAWRLPLAVMNNNVAISNLQADASGTVYVAGSYQDSVVWGPVTLRTTSPLNADGCVFAISPQGAVQWGVQVSNGAGNESINNVAVVSSGDLCVVGTAVAAARLGTFALPATGSGSEVIVGRFTPSIITGTHAATASPLLLAPNPAHHTTTLTLPAASAPQPLALLDALGRPVRQFTVPAGASAATLDMAGLPAGLYVLRGAGASRKLVVE